MGTPGAALTSGSGPAESILQGKIRPARNALEEVIRVLARGGGAGWDPFRASNLLIDVEYASLGNGDRFEAQGRPATDLELSVGLGGELPGSLPIVADTSRRRWPFS